MRIKNQKKMTCMIGALAVLASMIFLAEGVHGMDVLFGRINTLEGEKKKVETELQLQAEEVNKLRVSVDKDARTLGDALGSLTENLNDIPGPNLVRKVGALKETLVAVQEEKESSEKKCQQLHTILEEVKRTTGGSGAGTPILPRLKKLHSVNETAKLLEEKLRAVPGDSVEDKVVGLKETLEANQKEKERLAQQHVEVQHQIAELKIEIGEEGEDTPPVTRVRTLSNSLKKDTNNLKEAINGLSQKLAHIPGEDCADKVDGLITTLALTQEFLNVIGRKLNGLPGDGLIEKLEILMEEREVTKAVLENMQETITNKEEAYNNLHIELLRAQHEVKVLDAELSETQVAHSEKKAEFNQLLNAQFNRIVPVNGISPTRIEEASSTK